MKKKAPAKPRLKPNPLWKMGALFHVTDRYPHRPERPRIDRLAGILRHGLLAPSVCSDGTVFPNLNITYEGAPIPYDSLVFLHLMGEDSWLYTMCTPGRFAVFVDPAFPVITQEALGESWCVLCQDEVYVRERVGIEHIRAIAVTEEDAEPILRDFADEFDRTGVAVYDWFGKLLRKARS